MNTLTPAQKEIHKAVHDLSAPLVNLKGFHQELDTSIHQILNRIGECREMLPDNVNKDLDTLATDDVVPMLKYLLISIEEMQKRIDSLKNEPLSQTSNNSQ